MVQYAVLRWATDYPCLIETTGMLPLLELLSQYQLFEKTACQQLSEAFRCYRAETHRLALQNQPAIVAHQKFVKQRQQVKQWWSNLIEAN